MRKTRIWYGMPSEWAGKDDRTLAQDMFKVFMGETALPNAEEN
jgi:hypothetical protein